MRTFIAIDLPDAVKRRVTEQQRHLERRLAQGQLAGSIRWTPATNLHLTLRFLGDTNPQQAAQIQAELAAAAPAHAPMALALGGLGCFPNFRRPNIIWLDFSGELPALTGLQRACEGAAQAAGFAPEERPFTPHLTIGRVQRSVSGPELQRCGEVLRMLADTLHNEPAAQPTFTANFTAKQVIWMESDLQPAGSIYTALAIYPLAAPGEGG